jgi:hypothetical protein
LKSHADWVALMWNDLGLNLSNRATVANRIGIEQA